MDREVRSVSGGIERRGEDGGGQLVGHAAIFRSPAMIGNHFREMIEPGAFRRAIEEAQDVRALIDHDASRIIGRSAAGTLKLSEDDRGLLAEIDVPDTQLGRDLLVSVARGDITQMSFAFSVRKEEWSEDDEGIIERKIKDVDLYDVSPVTYPAYEGTDIAVRSLEGFRASRRCRPGIVRRRMSLALIERGLKSP